MYHSGAFPAALAAEAVYIPAYEKAAAEAGRRWSMAFVYRVEFCGRLLILKASTGEVATGDEETSTPTEATHAQCETSFFSSNNF